MSHAGGSGNSPRTSTARTGRLSRALPSSSRCSSAASSGPHRSTPRPWPAARRPPGRRPGPRRSAGLRPAASALYRSRVPRAPPWGCPSTSSAPRTRSSLRSRRSRLASRSLQSTRCLAVSRSGTARPMPRNNGGGSSTAQPAPCFGTSSTKATAGRMATRSPLPSPRARSRRRAPMVGRRTFGFSGSPTSWTR